MTLFTDHLFKRFGRVFPLKQAAEFFKHVPAELLQSSEKKKLDRKFVKFGQVFNKVVRVIKKLGHVFVL